MLRKLLDSPALYFAGAALLAAVALLSQFDIALPARPMGAPEDIASLPELPGSDRELNVVFILVDTLRSDRLGIYGYDRPTSPVIDDLGRQGIVFKRVVAQSSWTKTSMASLWTGTHPQRNGILRYNHVLPPEVVLPAEIFKEAGFRTAGIWRNGWVAPNFGFDQGFDVYFRPSPGRAVLALKRKNPSSHPLAGTDEDLLRSAASFLENFQEERFFLYLHMMDLHQYLFDEAAADFGPSYSDAYDKSINWTDRVIGGLVAKLEEHGLRDETIIAVASDHGEAFLEHGREGHAKNLYSEVTHVPFVIALPFRLDPGIEVETPIGNLDIWPTLLDLAGLPPLPNADGISRVPLALAAAAGDEPADAARPLFAQIDQRWGRPRGDPYPLLAVTHGDLRLTFVAQTGRTELFDLAQDPGEQTNLAETRTEDVAQLRTLIDDYLADTDSPWGVDAPMVELDEMQLNQLRALGYRVGTPPLK